MKEQSVTNPFSDELEHKWNLYTHNAIHLATGGESEVYELIGRSDVVVKFDWNVTLKIAHENNKQNLPLDSLDDEKISALQKSLKVEEEAYNDFKQHFGQHALVQKRYLIKIPYRKIETQIIGIIEKYKTTIDPPEYIWTIARIQRKVNFEEYEREFEGEFQDDGSLSGPDISDFLKENDPGFKQVLKDFVKRSIKYTNDTGHILDITGKRNVVFLKNEDGWDYKLIDAFYAGESRIEQAKKGNQAAIINASNYLQAISKLAIKLGINDGLRDFIAMFDY